MTANGFVVDAPRGYVARTNGMETRRRSVGSMPSRTGDLAALSLRPLLVEYCEEPSVIADTLAGRVHVEWETGNRGVLS